MILEDFIITTYCLIDDTLRNFLGTQKLRKREFEPNLPLQFELLLAVSKS